MAVREEAHQLLDAVPDDRLAGAVELLRRWLETGRGEQRRWFRTTAIFDGDPDLGADAKEIARDRHEIALIEEWEHALCAEDRAVLAAFGDAGHPAEG